MTETSSAQRPADATGPVSLRCRSLPRRLVAALFRLGGMSTAMELEAFLYGALQPSAHDREVIAQALNERFVELGGNHPVPYSEIDANGPQENRHKR